MCLEREWFDIPPFQQHYKDKCQELKCDRKCLKRHPKACRRSYDCEQEHTNSEGEKAIMEKIKSLNLIFEKQTKVIEE